MEREKSERRQREFVYRGNHLIVCKALGWEVAAALQKPNRFLKKFRDSNRSRAA